MFVKQYKGRRYYMRSECKKPYSFKTGRITQSGMERHCRHCDPKAYPPLPKKNVKS